MTRTVLRALVVAGIVAGPLVLSSRAQRPAPAWVTAWATSHQAVSSDAITNATVRMIARVTIPGDAVRIRLDNTFGTEPLIVAGDFNVTPWSRYFRAALDRSGLNDAAAGHGLAMAVRPVVVDADVVAGLEQQPNRVAADVSGPAGNKYSHDAVPWRGIGRTGSQPAPGRA